MYTLSKILIYFKVYIMYTFDMKKDIIKKILLLHYSKDSIKSILCGRRKPSYKIMLILQEKHQIPFEAWKDIKSFVTESVTQSKNNAKV